MADGANMGAQVPGPATPFASFAVRVLPIPLAEKARGKDVAFTYAHLHLKVVNSREPGGLAWCIGRLEQMRSPGLCDLRNILMKVLPKSLIFSSHLRSI
jgi:hypothetical protein